jgi:hypothetical protein
LETPAAKTLQGIEHLAIRDLQRLANVEAADRDMLAALEHTLDWIIKTTPPTSFAPRDMCRAAIAAARAAGITTDKGRGHP